MAETADKLVADMTEDEWARVFVDHDNACPQVAWREPKRGPCNCPAEAVYRKLQAKVYASEFAAEMFRDQHRDNLPAIKLVLAAHRSHEVHVTEEQVQAAWGEYEALRSTLEQLGSPAPGSGEEGRGE